MSVEAKVEQIFANLQDTMADIMNYYFVADVDQAIVPKMQPIRDRYISVERPPASIFVASVGRCGRAG